MSQREGNIQIILHAKVAMDEAVRAAVYRLRDEGHDIEDVSGQKRDQADHEGPFTRKSQRHVADEAQH